MPSEIYFTNSKRFFIGAFRRAPAIGRFPLATESIVRIHVQSDQIWRKFATLAKLQVFGQFLVLFWTNFGNFFLLLMAKDWK